MKRPWFPLYVADFLADTTHLTYGEVGAYVLLLLHHWKERDLPNDQDALRRIARVLPPNWPQVWKVLEPFFPVIPADHTRRYNPRMHREITKADEISNVRKGAAQQMHSKRSANVVHLHTQSTVHSPQKVKKAPPSEADMYVWPEDFAERFWEQYPRKVARKAAIKALTGVRNRREVPFDELMAAVGRYGMAVADTEEQYICHATTWLNQGRWDAQPPAKRNGAHHGRQFQKSPLMEAADRLVERARRATEECRAAAAGDGTGPIIDGAVSPRRAH